MANLTPELLERLEEYAKAATPGPWSLNGGTAAIAATYGRQKIFCLHVGGTYPAADAKHIAAASPDVVLALVEAAKERDQLREAVRLREHATLEAWSGSLVGLDAAEAASAQAEALEALAGIDTPTAEQQRDAALSKLGAVLLEKRQLRAEVERLRNLGLEAVEHGARNALQSPASLVRLYKTRAEIERKP